MEVALHGHDHDPAHGVELVLGDAMGLAEQGQADIEQVVTQVAPLFDQPVDQRLGQPRLEVAVPGAERDQVERPGALDFDELFGDLFEGHGGAVGRHVARLVGVVAPVGGALVIEVAVGLLDAAAVEQPPLEILEHGDAVKVRRHVPVHGLPRRARGSAHGRNQVLDLEPQLADGDQALERLHRGPAPADLDAADQDLGQPGLLRHLGLGQARLFATLAQDQAKLRAVAYRPGAAYRRQPLGNALEDKLPTRAVILIQAGKAAADGGGFVECTLELFECNGQLIARAAEYGGKRGRRSRPRHREHRQVFGHGEARARRLLVTPLYRSFNMEMTAGDKTALCLQARWRQRF